MTLYLEISRYFFTWQEWATENVLFGSPEIKIFKFRPHFPQMQIFGQFLTELEKILRQEALTMAMLICKLPLIVIVALWKLYSE